METKVDILIPSKDRVSQLHLLFESMNRCLKNIGKITVSFQVSTDDFLKSYQLLQHRIYNDDKFQNLRQNTTEIVFCQRDCISDVIKVVDNLGESDYAIPLVDDEIFCQPYDLANSEASKYFFSHESVLACSLRLGDNISADSREISAAAGAGQKPNFEVEDENILIWNWAENLNVATWSCITSITSHIYRKKFFEEWFCRFGRENFLNIEGQAKEDLVAGVYRVPRFVVRSINYINRLQMGILRRTIGVDRCKSIKQLFWEEWLYRRKPAPRDGIPSMMVAPRYSVCYNLELNNSINRGLNVVILAELNQEYLQGNILDYDYFANLKFYYPILFYTDPPKFVTY